MKTLGIAALVFMSWSISNPESLQGGDDQPSVWLRQKHSIIAQVKQLSAEDLDPAEPRVPLQVWLQRAIQPTTAIQWDVSDCDLKPDYPKPAHGYPMCVMALVHRHKLFVKLHVLVGTSEEGVFGKASVHQQSFMSYPRSAAPPEVAAEFLPSDSPMVLQGIDSLSDLRAKLGKVKLAKAR